MYKIVIENECGCFKKSGIENNQTFENREDAHMKAKVMECRMNQEFCLKHYFHAVDKGDTILIKSMLRPENEDDDLDIQKLLDRDTTQVSFNPAEETPNGK